MTEATISLIDGASALSLFGACDQHLRQIRSTLSVNITHLEGKIRVAGDEKAVVRATEALEELKSLAEKKGPLAPETVAEVLARVTNRPTTSGIDVQQAGRIVKPRSDGQVAYIQAIRENDLVLAIGPAGTCDCDL